MKLHVFWLALILTLTGCISRYYKENVEDPKVMVNVNPESSYRFSIVGLDSAPAVEVRVPLVQANVDQGHWVYQLQSSPSIYLWINLNENKAVIMDFLPDFVDLPIISKDTLRLSILKSSFDVEAKYLSSQNSRQHPLTASLIGESLQNSYSIMNLAVTLNGNSHLLPIGFKISGGFSGAFRDAAESAEVYKNVLWETGFLLAILADVALSPVYLVGIVYCVFAECRIKMY